MSYCMGLMALDYRLHRTWQICWPFDGPATASRLWRSATVGAALHLRIASPVLARWYDWDIVTALQARAAQGLVLSRQLCSRNTLSVIGP